MRVLVLGLGNPILGDDGLGLRVADLLRSRLAPGSGIEVEEEHRGGLRLMERLLGCDAAVIVDAIVTGRHPPGTILRLGPGDMPTRHSASGHDVNLPTALRLGRSLGLHLPKEVRIVAVEPESVLDFRDDCTAAGTAALPATAEAVLEAVGELRGPSDRLCHRGTRMTSRPRVHGLVALALLAGLLTACSAVRRELNFTVVFRDAKNLCPGQFLVLRGVRVGEVSAVDLAEGDQVPVAVRAYKEFRETLCAEPALAIEKPGGAFDISGERQVTVARRDPALLVLVRRVSSTRVRLACPG